MGYYGILLSRRRNNLTMSFLTMLHLEWYTIRSSLGCTSDFNLLLVRLNHSDEEEIDAINKIAHDGILKNVMVAVNGKKQVKSHGYYTEETKSDGSTKDGGLKQKKSTFQTCLPCRKFTLEKGRQKLQIANR